MDYGPRILLIAAVAAVGVFHTMVPDHWAPIALLARQRGWSRSETARASLQAGIGHVLSTLVIAVLVWLAGAVFAARFGRLVDTASSLALVVFGAWIAIAAWRELHEQGRHAHSHGLADAHRHDYRHDHDADVHSTPPTHEDKHKTKGRVALLLILGSSPMVEGIPAFFAASKYGTGLIAAMSVVFALSTMATYMVLCVYSTVGLQRLHLGAFERYGEVLSGVFIALVGVAFWFWSAL